MKIAIFHGSPRKGNTYRATGIFLDELRKCGDVELTEFSLPSALPVFCTGCQFCLGGPRENCPHAAYVTPIYEAIMAADALIFTTPHYGACSMSAGMKTLLDHLDFFTMNISPRAEIFERKAFIITTAAGSAAAAGPIKKFLKNWGINRVYTLGIRMFSNKWDGMTAARRRKSEKKLRRAARGFYRGTKRRPYLSTVAMYYVFRLIVKKFIGQGNYSYEYWEEKGYFRRRPF